MSFVLVALFGSSAWAQTRRISGRVTTEGSGEPIPAATVQVVGTTYGAATDDQGRFSVSAPDGPVTLRVRRIGYAPKTIAVSSGLADVNVSLTKDVLELDKQVITGTATTVASVNSANAVAVVSGERLNRVPAPTIDNALQGKVAGAVITQNSGAPGGGTQVQLRGVSTVNAGFQPLYVIDGVIVSNTAVFNGLNVITQSARSSAGSNSVSNQDQQVNRIADINPNDIESIQVLKGPSASSIYGSKGTNGVIIITTKQGRAGKSTLDIQQSFGKYTLANKIGPFYCFKSAAEADDFGFLGGGLDGQLWTAASNKCHDYEEELYGSNGDMSYQTVASLRGASGSGTNYYISGLVQHDNGLGFNDFYNKQSLRINLGQQFGSRLNVRAQTELIHSLTQRGVFGNDNTGINPYTTFSATPSFIDLQKQGDGSYPKNPQGAVGNNNPFQNAERIKTPENVYRMLGSLIGTYNIMSTQSATLDATLQGGIDALSDNPKIISPADIYIEQVNANPGTIVNTQANVLNANLNGTLAHRWIGSALTTTTSVGFRQDRRQSDVVNNIGRGIISGLTNFSAAVQTFTNEGQDLVKDFSVFAQEEILALNERLLFTAGVNAERSSNNGDQEKFYGYPKFSVSYRMPEYIPHVNEFKWRLAYGRAGNQPTAGRFTFMTTLFNEGRTGLRASTVKGATGIKPETASEIEGGFDLTAFDGRMRLSATQARKQIDNLLLTASVAPSTGFSSQWINGGQIVNRATEIELGLTPVQTGNFEWVSNTTYASVRGKVTRLPVPGFIAGPGSFGTRFGNGFIGQGLSPSVVQAINGCLALSSAGTCATANRVLTFVGDGLPDYVMGFNNDLTFGAFRLSSLLDWRKGSVGINLTNNYFDGGLLADTAVGNQRLRDFAAGKAVYVESTGFLKLRELTFGYELPSRLTSTLFNGRASAARVELSGRNLWTKTKYTGLDPEVSNFGNGALGRVQDVTPYPPAKSFFFVVRTTF
jgi:TonB-linked SusC/RagA family outer membrane protein